MSFYTEDIANGYNWKGLERAIARMMEHLGWRDINVIGGAGDKGGDVIATRAESDGVKSWVVQSKAVAGDRYIGPQAVNEAINALSFYDANVAAVATNGEFTRTARQRQEQLNAYTKAATKRALAGSTPANTIQTVFNETASVIQEGKGKQSGLFVLRSESGNIYVVSGGTVLKWETALRKALEIIANEPNLTLNGIAPSICLKLSVAGQSLTEADKAHISINIHQRPAGVLGDLCPEGTHLFFQAMKLDLHIRADTGIDSHTNGFQCAECLRSGLLYVRTCFFNCNFHVHLSLLPFGVIQNLSLFICESAATGIEQSHLHKRLDTLKLLSADDGLVVVFQMDLGAFPLVELAVSLAILAIGGIVAIRYVIALIGNVLQQFSQPIPVLSPRNASILGLLHPVQSSTDVLVADTLCRLIKCVAHSPCF